MKTFTRKIVALGAAAVAAISLAGCAVTTGNPAGGGSTEREDKDEYRVAYIARTQTDSFAAWLANEMKAEAENYDDITLEILDGQGDDEILNRAIENAIANKFDAIIVQANNADAQQPYIQQAVDAGIVTITTNPRVEGVDGANSVDASPYDQGAVVAEYALDLIPENAKVVVLTGPAGNFHSDQRRKAWEEKFFSVRPDVEIVAEDIANWQKNEALDLMEDWTIANPKIDAIISMNDNMAAGALEAVKGQGVLAFGVDGTPEAALLIKEGTMTATSLQSAIDLAKLNLKAVHDLLTGTEKVVNVDIDNPLITPDNSQDYIDVFTKAGLYK